MPTALPTPPFGTVVGRFLSVWRDGTDQDVYPDLVPHTGTVTIAPLTTSVRVRGEAGIAPVTLVTQAVVCELIDGVLTGPDGVAGVRLMASRADAISPAGIQYQVSFQLKNSSGFPLDRQPDPFILEVPEGATVDLSDVLPVAQAPAVITVVSHADRDAAEAAAERAETAVASIGEVEADIAAITDASDTAAASAAAADTSREAAEVAAADAASHSSAAGAASTAAESSATAAASSASTAAGHANTASSEAMAAASAAQDAARSVTTAANAANAAIVGSGEAASSATAAATSATAAATSASTATTASTQAKASETAAKTASVDAQSARSAAETARDTAVTARTGAETARDDAEAAAAALTNLPETVQDVVGTMFTGGNITAVYDDATGSITLTAPSGDGGLDPEATRDAIGAALVGTNGITVTINDAGDTITLSTNAATAATPSTIAYRGTNGTLTVATPTATGHAATKGYIDAHIDSTAAHGATSSPTPSTPVRRDVGGGTELTALRLTAATPVDPDHAVRRDYVDALKAALGGVVIRLEHTGSAYPAKAGPAGARYEFMGPVHPGALMGDGDTWIETAA